MKLVKVSMALALCASLFVSSCGMSNTGKGALIGGGGGGEEGVEADGEADGAAWYLDGD